MIGIGVAERTGFISMGLKVLVTKVPPSALTATVVFAGVMSLRRMLGTWFSHRLGPYCIGWPAPLAGLAAAYAGVSGGYSANSDNRP